MSDVQTRIAGDVKDNDVLLFMKGTPVFPQCGFSAMAVQILNHVGAKFKAVDVLADPEVREGIKAFSNWPHHSAALRQGRVCRRRRHPARDV